MLTVKSASVPVSRHVIKELRLLHVESTVTGLFKNEVRCHRVRIFCERFLCFVSIGHFFIELADKSPPPKCVQHVADIIMSIISL
jgi:hypothetical protein